MQSILCDISTDRVAESSDPFLLFISTVLHFSAFNSKSEEALMGLILNYVWEAKQKEGKKKNPIFINMEILPDVKSLEDMLVHKLAGPFEHALPADLKYLKCLSCCRQPVLTTQLDKQSATTEDMNSLHLLWVNISSDIGSRHRDPQSCDNTVQEVFLLSIAQCTCTISTFHTQKVTRTAWLLSSMTCTSSVGKKGGSGHLQAEGLCVSSQL